MARFRASRPYTIVAYFVSDFAVRLATQSQAGKGTFFGVAESTVVTPDTIEHSQRCAAYAVVGEARAVVVRFPLSLCFKVL